MLGRMQVAHPPEADEHGGPLEDAPTWRFQLGALLLVTLVAVSFGVGVVLPYLVNDLHLLPLAEVAGGGHDPKNLWPYGTGSPLALLPLAGLLSVTVGLLLVLGTLVVVGWTLWEWRGRTTRSARTVGRATLLLSVAVLATMWSPWGQALTRWLLD